MQEKLFHKYDVVNLWDYLNSFNNLNYAEYMIIMGCSELSFVEDAAKLYKQGYAKKIIATGGNLNNGLIECENIYNTLLESGISAHDILLERVATNTFENLNFSQKLIDKKTARILIAHRPFCKIRAYYTALRAMPNYQISIWSRNYSFDEYAMFYDSDDILINLLVGEIYRLIMYPKLKFFDYIEISDDVMVSYNKLLSGGYTTNIIDLSNYI